jgi:2-keto-4-pentenoate hydratase/2-oxohepta-3-ene-1,7-dioic acid hydratase in catechol pathway
MTSLVFNGEAFLPGKIVCVGRNYVDHIKELGNDMPDDMVVFCKPNTAVSDSLLAEQDEPLHYEAELCFLVNDNELAGVGIGLDLTKRNLQNELKKKGLPWERAKAFDGAATFSYFVPVPEDLSKLTFTLHIDNELMQQGDPSLMIYSPETILLELSRFMTLNDDDIIMTGTPKGVGTVKEGSQFVGRVYYDHELLIEHTWIGQ